MSRRGAFREGEPCLLLDVKDREHLITLAPGSTFQFDRGTLGHDEIIGVEEGSTIRTSNGSPVVLLRPRLADYVLRMKRGAAVMYPKDTGALLTWADVGPGDTVVEAGTGSGALTMALSRAVGPEGRVVTVEQRDDHATHARRLISGFFEGVPGNIELRAGDVVDVIEEIAPDRIVLDLPEPWRVVDPAAAHLPGGGVFACYVPNVPQVQRVRAAIDGAGVFLAIDTFEILMRSWAVEERSVRPDHRMVGHTGFITVARKRLRIDPA